MGGRKESKENWMRKKEKRKEETLRKYGGTGNKASWLMTRLPLII